MRVKIYLEQCGTRFASADRPLLRDFDAMQRRCLRGMAAVLKSAAAPSSRVAHHFRGGGDIVRHPKGQFLNLQHRLLASLSSCVDLRALAEAQAPHLGAECGAGTGAGAGAGAGVPGRGGTAADGRDSPRAPRSPTGGLHRRTLSSATVDQPDTWSTTPTYMLEVRHGDTKPSLLWRLARRTAHCVARKVRNVSSSPHTWRAVSSVR